MGNEMLYFSAGVASTLCFFRVLMRGEAPKALMFLGVFVVCVGGLKSLHISAVEYFPQGFVNAALDIFNAGTSLLDLLQRILHL